MDAIEALVLLVERVEGRELTRRRDAEEVDMALAGRLCDCWTGAGRIVLAMLEPAVEAGRDER